MMNLKSIRNEKNLTQVELAKRVGVSLQAYRWWEQGVANPNPENYKKLCKVLETELER